MTFCIGKLIAYLSLPGMLLAGPGKTPGVTRVIPSIVGNLAILRTICKNMADFRSGLATNILFVFLSIFEKLAEFSLNLHVIPQSGI